MVDIFSYVFFLFLTFHDLFCYWQVSFVALVFLLSSIKCHCQISGGSRLVGRGGVGQR